MSFFRNQQIFDPEPLKKSFLKFFFIFRGFQKQKILKSTSSVEHKKFSSPESFFHTLRVKYASGGFYEPHRKFIAANSISFPIEDLPDSVDWRTKDAVTPVKSQRDCNACYAFSVTGLLESFYFINNGQLLSFSEQQIMSCDFEGNQGCNGGFPSFALKYAVNNGLETDDDYPYLASDFSNCKYEKEKAFPVAGGYKFVTANSTDQLKAALVNSPVSVLVQADQDVFKFYESGVIKKYCDANVNFAALAVGYKKIGLVEAFIVNPFIVYGTLCKNFFFI